MTAFPNLTDIAHKKTSEKDSRYNCIAWAFGDNQKFWWPSHKRTYWPFDSTAMTCSEAFEKLFSDWGWEEVDSNALEDGFEKIALFTLNGEPTHASRLLKNGKWTSKLGQNIDLSHDLDDLNGPAYGEVHKIYRKTV